MFVKGQSRCLKAISSFTQAKNELLTGVQEMYEERNSNHDKINTLVEKNDELDTNIKGANAIIGKINEFIGG